MIDNKIRRKQDVKDLKKSFYQSFDRSNHESLIRSIVGQDRIVFPLTEIGEGAHFRVFKTGLHKDRMFLTLNIAKESFFQEKGSDGIKNWLRCLNILKANDISLVPPIEIIEHLREGILAVILPFGPDPFDAASLHWLPFSEPFHELKDFLNQKNLMINDKIQGRSFKGVPFIFDFSDLSFSSALSH